MPSPVASLAGVNSAASRAASTAPTGTADLALDFAALLFAAAETPAAPGLAFAAGQPPALVAAADDQAADQGQALIPVDLAGLPALLAAVVLPGQQLPADNPAPTLGTGSSRSGRNAAVPALQAPITASGTDPLMAPPLAMAGTGVADAASAFAVPEPQVTSVAGQPANISDPGGKLMLPEGMRGEPTAGTAHHPLASGQHQSAITPTAGNSTAAHIDTPLSDSRWHDDFGQKIVWLAKQDTSSAQISINPPNLGPIDVSLKLGSEQATAVFSSPHADVREALEAALPRLREMFAGAGIQLGDAQVNAQSQQQAGNQPRPARDDTASFPGAAILSESNDVNVSSLLRTRFGNGLVDTFA